MAVSAWIGAAAAVAVAPLVAWAGIVGALWSRRSMVLLAAVLVLAGSRAHGRAASTNPSVTPGAFDEAVEVVSDPLAIARGTRLDVAIDGVRYEAIGFGPAGARLRDRLVGERVVLRGAVRPVRADTWAGRRGVGGAISVDEVVTHSPASGHKRLANEFRLLLERGSVSMATDDQALFLGMVYGDDRNLSVLVDDDFKAAGLTHLVAVSGQNVAFVLVVVAPLLRRLGPWPRWSAVLGILILFGTITRFEPSVMRSIAMAVVAATATALGREATATRTLSMAVAGLVVFDPSLVHQLGFRLSVAATAGILWIAPAIARLLPGPRVFREALGVTAGAQLAVSPMLVLTFGAVPVASLPANLLAGPASAPVMIWGLTGGVAAGLAPPALAAALHWPTAQLTGWLRLVARLSAQAPLGQIGRVELIGGVAVVTLCLVAGARRAAGWFTVAILALPSLVFAVAPTGRFDVGGGLVLWRGDSVVVEVGPEATPAAALSALRHAGVGTIDVVVLTTGAGREEATADAVTARHRVGATWRPEQVGHGAQIVVGAWMISRTGADDEARLAVTARRPPP
jgi:competence protein ComEC